MKNETEKIINSRAYSLLERAGGLSVSLIFTLNIILLIFIAFLDYWSGYEIAFSIFYIMPVSVAAWLLGKKSYWFFSFLSALLWMVVDVGAGHLYSNLVIAFWNGLVGMGFFIMIASLLYTVKNAFKREKIQSRIDFLTGIPNARSFYETGEKEIARAKRYKRPLTLAYIDADNFKQVNDKEGHDKGDVLIKKIGEGINRNIRGSDFAARLGGDEFAIIFTETDAEKAKIIVNNIKIELDKMINKAKLPVTFSIGVVTCAFGNCTIQELIKQADSQMYKVKKRGKNNMSCYSIK